MADTAPRARQASAEAAVARALADTLLIWRCGADKQCDYFNPGWLAFTGRTLAQELGYGWAEGVHPDDRAACLAQLEAAFASRAPFRLKYRLRRHDGAYRLILDQGVPFTDEAGRFAGYIGACMDIQDHVQDGHEAQAAPGAEEALPTTLPGAALNTVQAVIALLRLKAGRLTDEAAAAQLRSVADYALSIGRVEQALAGREAAGQVDLGAYLAGLGKALVRTMAGPACGCWSRWSRCQSPPPGRRRWACSSTSC